jgi:hypothetical protein
VVNIVSRLAALNWIAVVLTPVAVILMEAFWVYPWLLLIGRWRILTIQQPPLSMASVIFLLGISFITTRFLLKRNWSLWQIQLCTVSCALLAIFVVLRVQYGAGFPLLSGQWFLHIGRILLDTFQNLHPLLIALVVGTYLWWRGISRGRSPLTTSTIYTSFLVGIAALVILIIVWRFIYGAGSLEVLASTVAPYVAAFFFFGLSSLALGNLHAIQQRTPPEETVRLSNRRWLPILFGIVVGIVLVGIGISSIFSPEFVTLLGRFFGSVLDVLREVFRYLLYPLEYIAAGLYYVMRFIINLIRGGRPLEPFETPEFFETEELPAAAEAQGISEIVIMAMKWTFFAIIAIVVLFLLAKAISRYRTARARADVDEVNESLWSWEGFTADLRLFFRMLLGRFRRRRKEAVESIAIPDWYTEGEEVEGILDIREIYRRMLWLASHLGIARHRYETPYEYTRRLVQSLPGGTQQLGELTDIYVGVRYGELEAGKRQVSRANRLWRAIRNLLRRPENDQPAV